MAQSKEEVSEDLDLEKTEELASEPSDPSRVCGDLSRNYDELNDRFLRLAADFENYKKRTERDFNARIRFAIEDFAAELLEVADNFERALQADNVSSREGLEQIGKLFGAILERHGIKPVEALGKRFNPSEHEAVAYLPSEAEEGIIIDEFCHGYCMHDKVLRCAKVAVSKGRECESQ